MVKEITWQLAMRRADSPDPAVASLSRPDWDWLVTLYFALMGVVMVIAAVLIFRNWPSSLYAVAFIASVIWAISDAGWNYWPLFSRLFALGVLAFPGRHWSGLSSPAHRRKKGPAYGVAAVLAVALAVSFGWMFKSAPLVSATEAVPVKPVAPGRTAEKLGALG